MIQSILVSSPGKTQNKDLSSAVSVPDGVTDKGLKAEENEVKPGFSDLFASLLTANDKAVAGKGQEEKAAAVEGSAEQEGLSDNMLLLESGSEQVASEMPAEDADADLASATDIKEEGISGGEWLAAQTQPVVQAAKTEEAGKTEETQKIADPDEAENREGIEAAATQAAPALKRGAEDKPALQRGSSDESRYEGIDAKVTVEKKPTATPVQVSILEQIETAKKVDTQVTEAKKMAPAESAPELSTEIKKGQEKQPGSFTESSLAAESARLKAADSDTKRVSESLKAETAQAVVDKIDPFSLLAKSATEHSPLTSAVDASVPRAANTELANLSKSINQNLSAATPSPALDQPLDLQAKHASALLGTRILMMIGQGKQEVNIRLDPAELGSMHIKLQVQQDQVQLTIHTQVAQSRDLIEQHLPRLREQLAQQGVSLGETSVEQQSQQQGQNHQGKNGVQEKGRMAAAESPLQVMGDKTEWIASKIALPAQGIDYYA